MREIQQQRKLNRPGAVDRLSGSAEKLSRAANSWTVTAQRMRESEQAMRDHQARLAVEHADVLRGVVERFVDALGLELDAAVRSVLSSARAAACWASRCSRVTRSPANGRVTLVSTTS